jgi:aminoglycoside phosphotransferase (APT) family kinase protein
MPLEAPSHGPVLLPPIEGRSLRQLLLSGGSLPSPERVAALLDQFPEAVGALPGEADGGAAPRLAATTRDLVARLVPEAGDGADRVAGAVAEGAVRDQVGARVIHGDLYEAQVFVGDDYGLGLIDLDDAGPGDPAMDAANFSVHLIALALVAPAARKRLMAYRGLVRRAFLARLAIGPSDLAWREALCMLRLATGPFRVLDPHWPHEVRRRVDLAVRLIDAA